MRDLAIYGAGGLGRELASMVPLMKGNGHEWNFIGFFDDGKAIGAEVSHFGKVLGGAKEINAWTTPLDIVIGVGTPAGRRALHKNIDNPMVEFPNFIHPDFNMFDPESLKMGEGNVITRGCCATVDVTIGNFNLLNGVVTLAHDDVVGDYNVFLTYATIAGEVTMGDGNQFGSQSFVIQQTKIGNNVRLGAGSVLMTRPKDDSTYIGVPAKLFRF